eukprot:852372-Prymnesium_polylepis.1
MLENHLRAPPPGVEHHTDWIHIRGHARGPTKPPLLCVHRCALLQHRERVLDPQEVAIGGDALDDLLAVHLHLLLVHRRELARL